MLSDEYLTVAEALEAVLASVAVLPAERVHLGDALGLVLAEPIVAATPLPPFANSAMDGYALTAADSTSASQAQGVTLRVVDDIAAGSVPGAKVLPGTAARIMTGAPLPPGADAVIPVEDTDEPYRDAQRPLPEKVTIYRAVGRGDYVRPAGEDVAAGERVLESGTRLRPQEIGLLAALGVARPLVIRRPRVGILATGDELIAVNEPLTPGKIRNSNGYTQAAQVREAGAEPVWLGVAGDTETAVRARLQAGLDAAVDLFVSSAGVSVGAYDVVKGVLEAEGAMGFWKVRMRPGKPLAYGRYGGVPYLGLPGNPVSAMVSFERFARPAIRKMGGHRELERPLRQVRLQTALTSDGRESYIRARVQLSDGELIAMPTGAQGSNIMSSLVAANALVIIPEGQLQVDPGALLPALMIDWPEYVF